MIEFLFLDVLSYQEIDMIEDFVYCFLIFSPIVMCTRFAYQRLVHVYGNKRFKKFVLICVFSTTLAAFIGSISVNMFYHPQKYWSLGFFFEQIIKAERITFHGGLILSTITLLILTLIFRFDLLRIFDTYFLYIPLGHASGRLACLLIGCCWGKICQVKIFDNIWIIKNPIPAYSIIFLITLFLILRTAYTRIYEDRSQYKGIIISIYFIFYSIFRFNIEFYRIEPIVAFGLFTQAQMVMIFFFLIGFSLFTTILITANVKKN